MSTTLPNPAETIPLTPGRTDVFDKLALAAEEAVRMQMEVPIACRWLAVMMRALEKQERNDAFE